MRPTISQAKRYLRYGRVKFVCGRINCFCAGFPRRTVRPLCHAARCSSFFQIVFPYRSFMRFVHALDAVSQLSAAFGKLPYDLIFATGRPSAGKVAAQGTDCPERNLGVIIVSYRMSLATSGERPNGINRRLVAPAAKVNVGLSTTGRISSAGFGSRTSGI